MTVDGVALVGCRRAHAHTLIGLHSRRILPHDLASSGLAPLSLPSNGCSCVTRQRHKKMQVYSESAQQLQESMA